MKRLLSVTALLILFVAAAPASAAGPIYVDDGGLCDGNSPCYTHPQDAVNAAAPGDRILVYPGTYGSRAIICDSAPDCSPNDSWAPTLIVYKDNLTITAVSKDPTTTIIEATHGFWSNPEAVEKSTAGGVQPAFGSEPNAVSIIASGVSISGFTIRRSSDRTAGGHSNVLIGGLYLGYGGAGEPLGYRGNTVSGNIMDGGPATLSRNVSIWHSSDNSVTGNLIIDPDYNAIEIFDGHTEEEARLPSPSQRNRIAHNIVIDNAGTLNINDTCIFVGLWPPLTERTDNSGTRVQANDCGGKGLAVVASAGTSLFAGNRNVGYTYVVDAEDALLAGNTGALGPGPRTMVRIPIGPPQK